MPTPMKTPPPDWRPTASLETLRLRAQLLAAARNFFAHRDILEVETPALVRHGVTDRHLQNMHCRSGTDPSQARYLHTSPEYHMKRLLASGSPDIYQICKVFRDAESGRRHHPEFSMIEWYRIGFTLDEMITDTCALIVALARTIGSDARDVSGDVCQYSYQQVFENATGLDPISATASKLRQLARQRLRSEIDERLLSELGNDVAVLQDLLMTHLVIPALDRQGLVVIHHYPATQAALARIDPADDRVAERFEIFHDGMELANGYRELTDSREQQRRLAADLLYRQQAGLPDMEPDPALLAALDHGLPECSGVAVGFDRLLMSFSRLSTIQETISFTG